MTLQGGLTIVVLLSIVAVRERVAPSASILLATIVLLAGRVISVKEALSGFSHPATITVAALYVLAKAVHRSGVLQRVVDAVLGTTGTWRMQLVRLLLPSAAISAFLNNTPIVAMLVPPVTSWADDRSQPPSKYLLPMTYAVSVGGTLTLIGTSTNLVASGIAEANGQPPIGMFEMTPIGAPVAILGLAVLLLVTPLALPLRRAARELFHERAREFLVTMTVVPAGPLDGSTVQDAGLRRLEGVFLVAIDRRTERIAPVTPSTSLSGGDELTFVGNANQIVDLQRIGGLASSEHTHIKRFDPRAHPFFEAVIGPGSPLVGRTLKDAAFRSRYQAAVIAIHRRGEPLHAKLGEVKLRAGDTLLFIADPGFRRNDFLLVSRIGRGQTQPTKGGLALGLLLLAVIVVSAAGIVPLLEASLFATVAVIVLKLLPAGEVRDAIDLDVIGVVAGSFALGAAIQSSGLAKATADVIVRLSSDFGPRAALLLVVLFTIAMAQILTCNSAAAVGVPLAIAIAKSLGMDARPFLIGVTIAASTTYLTPFGYQTKMMVYGPGGYRFGDYVRLGLPLTISVVVAIVVVAPLVWSF